MHRCSCYAGGQKSNHSLRNNYEGRNSFFLSVFESQIPVCRAMDSKLPCSTRFCKTFATNTTRFWWAGAVPPLMSCSDRTPTRRWRWKTSRRCISYGTGSRWRGKFHRKKRLPCSMTRQVFVDVLLEDHRKYLHLDFLIVLSRWRHNNSRGGQWGVGISGPVSLLGVCSGRLRRGQGLHSGLREVYGQLETEVLDGWCSVKAYSNLGFACSSQNDIEETVRRSTNLLFERFSNRLKQFLVDEMKSSSLVQLIQITINMGYLEKSCEFLEKFISTLSG